MPPWHVAERPGQGKTRAEVRSTYMDDSLDLSQSSIAIIGMAGRFPGARDLDEFWRNLSGGVESVVPLTEEQLLAAGVAPAELRNPNYVRAAAVLDDIDLFDAAFFGLSPKDAAIMDPQHRVFLECAWHALEHAACAVDQFEGRVGVYAGSGMKDRKSTRLNSSHEIPSRMPSSA